MSTVTYAKQSDGVNSFRHGSFTSDGSAQIVTLGFVPNCIEVINETDTIFWKKFQPMAAANCLKITATTLSVETSSDILFNSDGTVTLSATLVGTSKAIKFRASL